MIKSYGADALRLFILFAAPPEKEFAWNEDGIDGCYRFVCRVWQAVEEGYGPPAGAPETGGPDADDSAIPAGLVDSVVKALVNSVVKDNLVVADVADVADVAESFARLQKKMHQTVRKVGDDIGKRFHLNTAVSSIMELTNALRRERDALRTSAAGRALLRETQRNLVLLLAPFTPHVCEEMWSRMGETGLVCRASWPAFDPALAQEEKATIVVEINGKIRDKFEAALDISEDEMRAQALASPRIQALIGGKAVRKVVCIKNKIVNIVL
jgi:leucyl-tRNA synthetase